MKTEKDEADDRAFLACAVISEKLRELNALGQCDPRMHGHAGYIRYQAFAGTAKLFAFNGKLVISDKDGEKIYTSDVGIRKASDMRVIQCIYRELVTVYSSIESGYSE